MKRAAQEAGQSGSKLDVRTKEYKAKPLENLMEEEEVAEKAKKLERKLQASQKAEKSPDKEYGSFFAVRTKDEEVDSIRDQIELGKRPPKRVPANNSSQKLGFISPKQVIKTNIYSSNNVALESAYGEGQPQPMLDYPRKMV